MIKKCSKILIASLCVFLISIVATSSVNAKEMNIDQLTEAIIDYNPDVADIYIIGNYVFTSEFKYELEDIMLSARSIEVKDINGETNKDAIHGEMSILHYEGTYDSDWNLNGFTPMNQLAGVAKSADKFDVKFIDYNRYISTIDLKAIVDKYIGKVSNSVAIDKVNNDITNLNATIKDLNVLPTDEIKELANEILGTEGVKSVTLTLITSDGKTLSKEITSADVETLQNMSEEDLKAKVKEYASENGLTVDSIIGGKVTAKVNLESGFKAKDGADTFTSTISAEVDLKSLADKAYNKYETEYADKLSDIISVEKANDITNVVATLNIAIIDLDSIPTDEIKEQAKSLLDKAATVPGVESVTITLTTSDGRTISEEVTLEDVKALTEMSADELKAKVKEYVSTNSLTIDSVNGGKVAAKVNLKPGYSAKDGVDTFTVSFGTEIDFKGLANAAYNKYEADYAEKLADYVVAKKVDTTAKEDAIKLEVNAKVLIPDTSLVPEDKINELKEKYKDEIQKIRDLLDKVTYVPGMESVTVTLTTAEGEVITKTITEAEALELKDKSVNELKALAKEFITGNSLTIDSVVGGEVAAKVNLKPGYSAKDGADTFKVSFKTEIDFKGIANKVYNKYEADYAEKLADYVIAKKVDTTAKEDAIKLEVNAKVLIPDTSLIPEDKINELKDKYKDEIQKIRDLLDKVTYVPGMESVTVTLTTAEGTVITKTITEAEALELKDKSVDELKALAKDYISSNSLTIDSIMGGEVAAKVNLKPGYSAKDGADTFKVSFKTEIDFKGIANKVYNKYEADYAKKLADYVVAKKVDTIAKEDAIKLEITAKVLTTDMSLIPQDKINELKEKYADEIKQIKELINKATYIPGMESITGTLITSDGKILRVNITEAEALELKEKSVDELKALIKEYIKANNLTIDSIIGGEVAAEVNLKPGYSAKDDADTFKVLFKAEYDLETLANTAYNKFDEDYAMFLSSFATVEQKTATEYNVTVKTTDEAMLTKLANQLKAQLGNDLVDKVSSIPGVDTITVKLTTSDSRTLSKDVTVDSVKNLYNMSVEDAKVVLKALARKHNLDINSILGGSVEAKINLKEGYSATKGVNTFKVNFLASEYDVKFDVDGVKTIETVKVGETVSKPVDPTKEGYTFDGWLLNGTEYDFSKPVNMPITLTASWKIKTYEVKFESNNSTYGTISESSITLPHGSTIKVNGNKLEITDVETAGTTTITATAAANTAEYKYSFDKWENVQEKVTGPLTIKANFKQEESKFTVTIISNDALGTVDIREIKDVKYGTEIKIVDNTLTIDGTTVTATANTATTQYTYSFVEWTAPDAVKDDIEIEACFKSELNKYTVSFATNGDELGSVSEAAIYDVPYGTAITVEGNKITIGEKTIEATPATNTADYKYSFKEWTNVPESKTVTGPVVIYANFNQTEINKYTVTFVSSDSTAGKVDKTSITDIEEGTAILIDGNKLTINGETVIATANDATAQHTYSFADWTAPATVTGDIEVKANFNKTLNNYTVTLKANNDTYGKLSTTLVTVPYGSTVSVSGNTITIGDKTITATPTTKTTTNYYKFKDLSSTANITGDTPITVNFEKLTIVDVAGNVSSAVNANYGSNNLGESHSMDFTETTNNTITLKYSGTKSSKWLLLYTLNGTAVESFDIIQLMEKLTDGYDSIYESVIWDYKGWKTKNDDTGEYEYLDILKLDYDNMNMLGFNAQNWSCTIFSRFMSNLSGLSGGKNFANIDMNTIVANTTANPIKMKIKLAEGYCTADGETEVTYNVVFAK